MENQEDEIQGEYRKKKEKKNTLKRRCWILVYQLNFRPFLSYQCELWRILVNFYLPDVFVV